MKKILTFVAAALIGVSMQATEKTELKLYSTNFQDWAEVASSTDVSTKTVTTRYSNESLTFSFAETQILPTGTNAKFTADVITAGYAMAAKTATPYIETSKLASVTKVHYVHAATGGSRGWGLKVKGDGDEDWVTIYSTYCAQAGTAVDVQVNRENVQLRWYNLASNQNAYMTELAIYGMAEDDGQAIEYTISYYDQNGEHLGDSIQTDEQTLGFKYTEKDLNIPAGYKFRGWYDAGNFRHEEGEAITADLRLNAMVTPIEVPTEGAIYTYDLTKNYFYPEDHELIELNGGSYYNNHGWYFAADGSIRVKVSAKAVVAVTLCTYSESGDIIVTDSKDQEVGRFTLTKNTTADGAEFIANYSGEESWLTIHWTAKQYIHQVKIYNVKDFVEKDEKTGYYMVPAGDAASFILALVQANGTGDAKIFLPNGTYDLGETVLTTISANNIAIIGQSMEGTIIKNAPDYKTESIDKTATLKVNDNVQGTYFQDLTIQNALDYYKTNNGRAVCLWDRGTQTICKNVRLLSYQDTYYSNKAKAVKYFEDCEIHGTVDFICGDGSVYFKNNLLYCEKRNAAGGGSDVLTASNADVLDRGYVFEGCTIKSECPIVSLGRAWNNTPQTTYLNTLVDYSAGEFEFTDGSKIQRWTKELMNAGAWPQFLEYNTHLANGTVLTPDSNKVEFIDTKDGNKTNIYETVLSEEGAAFRTMEYTLGEWAATAAADAKQAECESEWADLEADAIYMAESEGEFVMLVKGSEVMDKLAVYDGKTYILRKANARGGFGKPADQATAIDNTQAAAVKATKMIRNGQVIIVRDNTKYNVLGGLVK